MATLEVHRGRGRVDYVTITPDHPLMFGADPRCDIVLEGAGILPFHGRIRWKAGRYKVEATPKAQSVEVNGRRMISSVFRQGDEVRVGPCRLFLFRGEDDDVGDEAMKRGPASPKSATPTAPAPASARAKSRSQGGMFEGLDWARELEVAPPSVEETAPDQPAGGWWSRSKSRRRPDDHPSPKTPTPPQAPGQSRGRLARLWRFLDTLAVRDQAPGQERIWSSPLVLGLVTALGILILISLGLWEVITRTAAQNQYARAVDNLQDGEYRNAIAQFDRFLEANPKDHRAGKARVLRAMARVQQFTAGGAPAWSQALREAREMLHEVGTEPEFEDSRMDLAEVVLQAASGLADQARQIADAETLAEAESAVTLHTRIAGRAAETWQARARIPDKLEQAHAAVRKAETRAQALAAMDEALSDETVLDAYAARDRLLAEYPDLASDRQVVQRLRQANELVKRAVSFEETRRPAATAPRAEPFGPPTAMVLRGGPAASEPASASHPIVFALAEGFAFALDGATGAPLWQRAVGLSSPFAPMAVPGGSTVLVCDARHDELVRLDGRDGSLIWRQPLGEPVADPPLVLGNQVIQGTPSGTLLLIDLNSGELQGILDLARPLSRTPTSDETGQYFYVLAEQANLFVIRRDPLSCEAVEYVGHAPGSIPSAPLRVGRYLVVPENHELGRSRWIVYVLEDEGARVRRVQSLPLAGWTWGTPTSQGSVIWAVDDRGGVSAVAMGAYDAPEPFKPIARTVPDARPSGPAFAHARTEREVWVSGGRALRFDVDPERGRIRSVWSLGEAGLALAPIQIAGRLAVVTAQHRGGPGVAVWGIDPERGAVRWRTVLGTDWPLEPVAATDAPALATLATDGQALRIDLEHLASGGFVEQPILGPGVFQLPSGRLQRLDLGAGDSALTLVLPPPGAREFLVREGASSEFVSVPLPAPLGAPAVLWDDDLFVPGGDGRAYLIDPRTGASRAEPFVPPFDRERPTQWRAPVILEGDAVALVEASGLVRRIERRQTGDRVRLVVATEADLGAPLAPGSDPASTGEGEAVVMATADDRIRSLAARDLSPLGAWTLQARRAVGPVSAGGFVFVADESGEVHAFGPGGSRAWSVSLRGAPPIGAPVVLGDAVWFLGRDGELQQRTLTDGTALDRIALDVLPAGGPMAVGQDLVVPVAPGCLSVVQPEAVGSRQ